MDLRHAITGPGGCFPGFMRVRWRGLTTALAFILSGSLVSSGCMTTSLLPNPAQSRQRFPSDRKIRITLFSEDRIEVNPFHYITVDRPADFIYGVGKRINSVSGKTSSFRGKVNLSSSGKPLRPGMVMISDSEYVEFRPGDFVVVRRIYGVGMFCTGQRHGPHADSLFSGKVDFTEIQKVEQYTSPAWLKTLSGIGLEVISTAADAGETLDEWGD